MNNNIIKRLFPLLLLLPAVFSACNEETPGKYEMTDGVPTVYYIRPQSASAADSLLTGAYMAENICIVGDNLTSVQEVWFNDQKALLNINFITNNTLLVTVPNKIPTVRTDKIYFVTGQKDTVAYDFIVRMPGPIFKKFKCEWTPAGQLAEITGDYFFNDTPLELSIGGVKIPTENIVSVDKTTIVFVAPEESVSGEATIKTEYGNVKSKDIFRDDRGWITGFEPGFVGGWGRPAESQFKSDPAYAIKGRYCELSGTVGISGSWVGGIATLYANVWGEDNGVPAGNLFPSDPETSILKMEVNVLTPWSAGPMIFCFFAQGGYENWLWADGTAAGGGQPRGYWVPWLETGSYVSDGWITISVPLKDCKYNGFGTAIDISTAYGALGFGIHNRGNDAYVGTAECSPVILVDNIRVVPGE
ncbi:MAG: glycan-binding surface protein [Dysgonamonadaceae bacterium]|jgi:hypothetical protein|nr:glycan-binding surface protein [Dysgonamonadaceae bacterium]